MRLRWLMGTIIGAGLPLAMLTGKVEAEGYSAPPRPPAGLLGARPTAPPPHLQAPDTVAASEPPTARLRAPAVADPEVTGSIRPASRYSDGAPVARPQAGLTLSGTPAGGIAGLPPEEQPETGPSAPLPPHLRPQVIAFQSSEPVGTIVIDTPNTYLYLVLGEGRAIRYGVGVGRDGFTWSGTQIVSRVAEWPDWRPPPEMIQRQPYLPRFMAGGETNPMGARSLYLGDTIYRIHGTNQPSTIGSFVSSGCIRLLNEDIVDLYSRVGVGTRVVVLPGNASTIEARLQRR